MTETVYGGGPAGRSTYEDQVLVWQEDGAPILTKREWLASLKGDVGVVIDPDAVAWDVEANYATRAVTTDAGSSWIARRPTTGERPSLSPDAWMVLVPGVDLAFAEALEADLAAEIAAADLAMTQQVQTAGASASAAAGSAVLAESAAGDAQLAQAAAELAAGNAQAAALTCATWATLAALTGTMAGQGAEVLDSDEGTHTDPVVGGTVDNGGRYSWSVSPAGWRRIGDTGLTAKAAATDLLAEIAARIALVTGNDDEVGHIIQNALGFWIAQFSEDGGIWTKYLRISPDGATMDFTDPLGFHAASIGSDGITIKGGVVLDAIPGGDWIVADPLGFHLISVIDGVLYVKGHEVGPSNTTALAESAPEVDLLRSGIRRPACTDLGVWRNARGRALQGLGGARILCIGDSLTAGGSTEAGSLAAASYPAVLARLLGRELGSAALGWIGGKYGAGISAYDPRLTLGAGWSAVATADTLGGQVVRNTTTTNPLTFAPGQAWDTAELWVTGAGDLTLDIGGAVTVYTATGAVTKITYAAASLGPHVLSVRRVSGTTDVIGAICTDSTTPGVEILNAGLGGAETAYLLDDTAAYSPASLLPMLEADLVVFQMCINDRNAGLAPASYRAQFDAALDLLPPGADLLPVASASPEPGSTYPWSDYVAQINACAASRGVPFVDLTIAMGDRATIEAQGWNSDGVHLTRAGLAEKAHILSKLLTA